MGSYEGGIYEAGGERQIAVTHLGDLLLRPAYRPEQWRQQIQVFDVYGDRETQDLLGILLDLFAFRVI